jgi:hypothetical protein
MLLSSSPLVLSAVIAQLGAGQRPVPSIVDSIHSHRDSITASARLDSVPVAHVAFDFGAGLGTPFAAHGLELRVTTVPPATAKGQPSTAIQVRFLRTPDSLSADLTERVSNGNHIATMQAELPGRVGGAVTIVRLYDAQVVSTHLTMNDANIGLVQQRLDLEASIAQLTGELQDAERQRAVTESLDKRKLSSSLEVAHARATAEVLTKRLAVERERLQLVEQQIVNWTPIQEELVLSAARIEMRTR